MCVCVLVVAVVAGFGFLKAEHTDVEVRGDLLTHTRTVTQ